MARWIAFACLLVLPACFSDPGPPPGGSGATESNTGGACVPGTVLCECGPDQTCDTDLECTAERCLPVNCNAGEPGCMCMQPGDVCDDGWVCIDGVCDLPSSTSSMSSSPTSGPDPTTVDPSTETAPPTSGETLGTTSIVGGTGTGEATGTTVCGDMEVACNECATCTTELDCAELHAECMSDVDCGEALLCLQMCLAGKPANLAGCIADCDCAIGGSALVELVDCTENACEGLCPADFPCSSVG
jgi:hypothetical protein